MRKLKEKLKAKLSKNGGFTLVEMLIVVAIIAILIAVSIPLVGSALEKARVATDAANERAFKASLVSSYLLTEAKMMDDDGQEVEAGKKYCYDAVNGKVSDSMITVAYGKSSGKTNNVLVGEVNSKGEVTMGWAETSFNLATGTIPSNTLVSTGLIAPTP